MQWVNLNLNQSEIDAFDSLALRLASRWHMRVVQSWKHVCGSQKYGKGKRSSPCAWRRPWNHPSAENELTGNFHLQHQIFCFYLWPWAHLEVTDTSLERYPSATLASHYILTTRFAIRSRTIREDHGAMIIHYYNYSHYMSSVIRKNGTEFGSLVAWDEFVHRV